MRNKKISVLLVSLFMLIPLTACAKDNHEHTYATEWSNDATYHWHAATCEHTEEVKDKAQHKDDNKDYKCDVCNYQLELPHEHSFGEWHVVKEPGEFTTGTEERVCSCGEKETRVVPATVFSWGNYRGKSSLNLESPKLLEKKEKTFDPNGWQEDMNAMVDAINQRDFAKLQECDEKLGEYLDNIIEVASIAQAYFYASSDETKQELYEGARETRLDIINDLVDRVYPAAAESSDEIKMYIFETLDPVEIEKIINEGQDSADANELSNELNKIEDEADKLIGEASSYTEMKNIAAGVYLEEAKLIWELSEKKGQTPSEFLSELFYDRQYDRERIKDVLNFVIEYIAPVFPQAYKDLGASTLKSDSLYKALGKNISADYQGKCSGEYFDEYAQYMGGDFLDTYVDLWTDGYYLFSNSRKSLGTAYVDEVTDYQLVFFGNSYQTVDTIVHEFGHYYAGEKRFDSDFYESYDILETHSQGNEACFYNFMKTQYNSPGMVYYGDDKFCGFIATMVCSSSLVDVEEYIFSNKQLVELYETDPAKAKRQIIAYADLQVNKYFNGVSGLNTNYWVYGCLSPVYYASYITSAAASASLYAMDLEDAVAAYKNFVNDTRDVDEITKWNDSGMSSPFNKECFEYIKTELERIAETY